MLYYNSKLPIFQPAFLNISLTADEMGIFKGNSWKAANHLSD